MIKAAEILGIDNMRDRLKKFYQDFPDKVAAALYQEAQIEMTESKRRVPVKSGILRGSGNVEQPVRKGKMISVTLTYGGAAKAYAIPVHEDLTAFHKVGQAKYLESVLNESQPYMADRLARRIDLNKAAE